MRHEEKVEVGLSCREPEGGEDHHHEQQVPASSLIEKYLTFLNNSLTYTYTAPGIPATCFSSTYTYFIMSTILCGYWTVNRGV